MTRARLSKARGAEGYVQLCGHAWLCDSSSSITGCTGRGEGGIQNRKCWFSEEKHSRLVPFHKRQVVKAAGSDVSESKVLYNVNAEDNTPGTPGAAPKVEAAVTLGSAVDCDVKYRKLYLMIYHHL